MYLLATWISVLELMKPDEFARYSIGVASHARRILPVKVLGTAPEKTKWSYYFKSHRVNTPLTSAGLSAYFVKVRGPNTIHQDIMRGVQVKAFFNLGVRSKEDVGVTCCKYQDV